MYRRLVLVLVVPLMTAACGSGSGGGGANTQAESVPATTVVTTVTTSTAPAPVEQTSLVVYFLRGGRVAPTRVTVDRTRAVAAAALHALASQPPRGYSTAVIEPGDVSEIDGGVAKLTWPHGTLSHEAAAQVVYTLTEFPTIRAVDLPDGTRARRSAFEDVVPPIVLESPLPGDDVSSPVRVEGTASVFEATLVVELAQDGQVLQRKTVTASTGAPGRGTFSTSFATRATGEASVVAFSPSAADGSEQHRVEVPIRIEP